MYLVPILALAACPGITEKQLTISWVFKNESLASVAFTGSVEDDNAGPITVAAGQTGSTSTTVDKTEDFVTATVSVSALPRPSQAETTVNGNQLTVTAIWDGVTLAVFANEGGCAPATAARPASPLGPSVCTAPKTWNLVGVTGTTTGNFQDIAASGSGTLSGFNPPATVQEGETYTVSATFSGSLTAAAGWDGIRVNIHVFIADYNTSPGINPNTSKLVTITGTKSESVTVTTAWSPRPQTPSTTTFTLEAGGDWLMAGTAPHLVATYSKVP
jgi:hypothetical protein